jgi:hypothetical protein
LLEDFDDDDDTDPWNLDSKNKPSAVIGQSKDQVKPLDIKAPPTANTAANSKPNPFDQKVKPAFDDLEDIGFELDSDRPIEFGNKKAQNNAGSS